MIVPTFRAQGCRVPGPCAPACTQRRLLCFCRPQNGRQAAEEVGAAAVVDVAPLAGRLVMFLSGAVEHAVLPNFADRVAVTMWCQ